MIPYIVMIVAPYSSNLVSYWNAKKKARCSITIFFVILLALLILRSESMGTDIGGYRFYFNAFSEYSFFRLSSLDFGFSSDIEPVFILFNWLISRFSLNFRVYMTVVAVISILPIYLWYRKEVENPGIAISLFLAAEPIVFYVSGIRQGIAMAFIPFVYEAIKKKNKWKFLALVLAATFSHFSACIMLFMYPLYHIKVTRKKLSYILYISGFIFAFKRYLYQAMLGMAKSYFGKLDKYSSEPVATGAYFFTLFIAFLLIYCFIVVDEKQLNCEDIGMRNFLVISFMIQIFSSISNLIMRFNYYFLMFLPILISRLSRKCGVNSRASIYIIRGLTICLYCLFFIKGVMHRGSAGHYFPYVFMWND